MRVQVMLSVMLLVFILTGFMLPINATEVWSITRIDQTSGGAGGIVLDSNNHPHILYGHYENDNPSSSFYTIYASWNGHEWSNQTVPRIGNIFNFVLDKKNNPIFLSESPSGLLLLSWTGSNWTQQIVTNEDVIKGFLALDSNDNPHVVFTDDIPISEYPEGVTSDIVAIKYTSWNGSSWNTQTVDSPISDFDGIYLAIDSNNNPYILYGNETTYLVPNGGYKSTVDVKFSTWNGTTWNHQTAISSVGSYGNMVLDSKGYPHFIYRQDYPVSSSHNSTLSHAFWNGSSWNSQTVFSNGILSGSVLGFYGTASLALDSHDYPHVTYYNESAQESKSTSLFYARWTGTTWDCQSVGPNSMAVDSGTIVVDSTETVRILYSGHPSGFRPFASEVYCMYAESLQPYDNTASPNQQIAHSNIFAFTTMAILVIILIVTVVITIALYIAKKGKTKANPVLQALTIPTFYQHYP
jgi:hypothetical protein